MASTDLLGCWVHCAQGRDELVVASLALRDELMKGALPCPACGTPCGPDVEVTPIRADIQLMVWRDGRWQRSYLLKDG